MKIKTSELTGPALDWAVELAQLLGRMERDPAERVALRQIRVGISASTNWSRGGPIIEREEIGLKRNAPCSKGREWEASPSITAKGAGGKYGYGPTPLIAAMRCFVASKLGDEVEVPEGVK